MKAYKVYDVHCHEGYQEIVFATTSQEAKRIAYNTRESCQDAEWIDLRVNRVPYLDGMENRTEKELLYVAMQYGWWYEVDGNRYDEESINEAIAKGIVTPVEGFT